ncbi:Dynein assembly factor 4, axonemal [Chytriomyces hyalinus]|nr:Dynein assembly factor 4, axonemal [Chytriomyces hyalinus]
MPLVVKTEDFTETAERVFISVPLNGVHSSKADIYANDSYIKINFPPFFYEADLLHQVDTEDSEAVVGDGCVKFNLRKVEAKLWGSLKPDASEFSAEEMKTRRADAFKRDHERVEKQKKEKAIKKREEHYRLIQEQLNVERAEKAKFERARLEEQRAAEEGIQQWKDAMATKKSTEATPLRNAERTVSSKAMSNVAKADSAIFDTDKVEEETNESNTRQASFEESIEGSEDDDDIDMEAIKAKVRKEMDKLKGSKPQPRETGTINFTFTSRGLIPTSTARESEDVKWIHRINQAYEKDAKSRRDNLFDPLSVDEKNPESMNSTGMTAIFLKDKGNAFFKTGNYQGAINAYTAALDLDPQFSSCLSNRAVCHLKLGAYNDCIQDCTAALSVTNQEHEILSDRDPVAAMSAKPAHDAVQVKVYVRRAAALNLLGRVADAVKDYERAIALDPRNDELKEDLARLKEQ